MAEENRRQQSAAPFEAVNKALLGGVGGYQQGKTFAEESQLRQKQIAEQNAQAEMQKFNLAQAQRRAGIQQGTITGAAPDIKSTLFEMNSPQAQLDLQKRAQEWNEKTGADAMKTGALNRTALETSLATTATDRKRADIEAQLAGLRNASAKAANENAIMRVSYPGVAAPAPPKGFSEEDARNYMTQQGLSPQEQNITLANYMKTDPAAFSNLAAQDALTGVTATLDKAHKNAQIIQQMSDAVKEYHDNKSSGPLADTGLAKDALEKMASALEASGKVSEASTLRSGLLSRTWGSAITGGKEDISLDALMKKYAKSAADDLKKETILEFERLNPQYRAQPHVAAYENQWRTGRIGSMAKTPIKIGPQQLENAAPMNKAPMVKASFNPFNP
jgi:hypothetical protein